jgi:Domain of unknown function in PX-proteins (DUF3818)
VSTTDPARTVQTFISLIQRHEHAFYNFVHKVHSKGQGLFDSLMRWIELFLTVMREGLGSSPHMPSGFDLTMRTALGQPISLDFILPHAGTQERKDIMDEVDKVALYHYKLKVLYEDKLRKRFGRASDAGGGANDEASGFGGTGVGKEADAEDEAARALVEGVIGEISFGELVKADALDVAAEEDDEEGDSSDESSEDESGSDESTSEYETGSDETTTDEGAGSARGSEKSLPPVPPQAHHARHQSTVVGGVKSSVPYAIRTQHRRGTGSMTSLRSPGGSTPPSPAPHRQQHQQQPTRKRSLSLKAVKSMSSLLGLDKDKDRVRDSGKATPPLPPLPPSVLNQPGGGRVSLEQGSRSQRPSLDIPSSATKPLPQSTLHRSSTMGSRSDSIPPSPAPSTISTSSYVTARGSVPPSRNSSFRVPPNSSGSVSATPGLPAVEDDSNASVVAPVRTSSPTMMDGDEAPPPLPHKVNGMDGVLDPTTKASVDTVTPNNVTAFGGLPSESTTAVSISSKDTSSTIVPPSSSAASVDGVQSKAATPPTESSEEKKAARKLKKNQVVEQPELKHIPALLPIFVEIVRPLLLAIA